jgi:DNA-binding transcriptional regulator YdaS (Cro superfamily)
VADRDLVIRAKVEGGTEAKAQVDGIKDSVEKLGEAQATASTRIDTGTSAENAYAAASEGLVSALQNAKMNMLALGEATVTGGQAMGPAFIEARDSVAALEVAIGRAAKVSDTLVTPAARNSLKDWDAQIAAIAPSLEKQTTATTGATKATTAMHIEMEAGRAAVGSWARGIEAAAQSSNVFVAAIGKFLLPLAAAAGAMIVFNKVATELKDRGVDIETIGDKWGHAMDSFAISVGGTSKAMAGMVTDMEKTQAAFTNLDASEKAYANGLNLLAAAGIGAAKPLETLTGAARDQAVILEQISSTSLPGYGKSLSDLERLGDLAVGATNRLNDQLNVIRATSPEVAKGFTEEYFAIQQMTTGSNEQAKALVNLNDRTAAAAKSSEDFTAKLALQFPKLKDAGVQYTTLVTNIEQLSNGYKLASAANLTEQQTMALLGPLVNTVAKGYETFGVTLRSHNPTLVAAAEAAHRIAAELDPLAVKMHGLALAVGEQTKAYSGMLDAIDAVAKKSGNYVAALTAEHSSIDSQIIALEKQKATTNGLSEAEQARLTSLLALHAVLTPLTVEQEKNNKLQDAAAVSIDAVGQAVVKLTAAYETDMAKIREHATTLIASTEKEFAAVEKSIFGQMADQKKQYDEGTIDLATYNHNMSALNGQEASAREERWQKEQTINKERDQSEADSTKKYEGALGDQEAAAKKLGVTLGDSVIAYAAHTTAVSATVAAIVEQAKRTAATIETHRGYETAIKDEGKALDGTKKFVEVLGTAHTTHSTALKTVHIPAVNDFGTALTDVAGKSIPAIETALDGLESRLRGLKTTLGEVSAAATAAFGGASGGSSGGADAGVGATPGSEGF